MTPTPSQLQAAEEACCLHKCKQEGHDFHRTVCPASYPELITAVASLLADLEAKAEQKGRDQMLSEKCECDEGGPCWFHDALYEQWVQGNKAGLREGGEKVAKAVEEAKCNNVYHTEDAKKYRADGYCNFCYAAKTAARQALKDL